MKLKDLIVPFTLALIGTVLIQYFFLSPKKDALDAHAADQRFIAPTSMQVAEPLDLDIDFYDAKPTRKKEVTVVSLPYGTLQFSNDGAIIDYIAYNRTLAGKPSLVETVTPSQSKELGAYLVALDGIGKTPYYYNLVDKKEEEGKTILTYKGESAAAVVTKQFAVHHDTYVIDLALTVEPKGAEEVRPRIFFPAPRIVGDEKDVTKAVLTSGSYLEKKPVTSLLQVGVVRPSVFGLEDTYFAQVLFKDPEQFTQRAYFKTDGETDQAVLQSDAVTEKTTWNVSFYAGPKELAALSKVDTRLEGLLSYGWFTPISKYLLYLLIFLYGIFGNYGVAIIALTLLVRLVLVPFTMQAEQSRKKTADMQKKLKYIEQRYKDDPEALARAKAEHIRKHGMGALGCLPMLLQIPVFIGLQRVLAQAIELYKASFLWIPDLSSPDPYYILPMLVGLAMAVQMSQVGDVRQQLSNMLIAVVVAAITANLSAGLTLFICVSTMLGLAQTYIQKAFA